MEVPPIGSCSRCIAFAGAILILRNLFISFVDPGACPP
jgi:hypothetical protein